ncbi:GAF domain-containing protein [Pseudofulvibacter geojedonensis]|uniref:GAF domain-containing protein n=1 Tax=Pseudofulvibacter geojedonensis TaxID=1123758 RepID=A0ABW3I4P3_9FLAO
MDITKKHVLPFEVSLSFKLLEKHYVERYQKENNVIVKRHLDSILECFKDNPELSHGVTQSSELEKLREPIDFLLGDLFPQALTLNEIKAATAPFQSQYFYRSQRFENIIMAAGEDFEFQLVNFTEDEMYVMSCSYILASQYGVNTNYQKPLYYTIPDQSGNKKTYRLTMNADFISMEPKPEFKEITQEDIDLLLQGFENIDLWKEKFPPNSWNLQGFILMTLSDVTVDAVVSDLKSDMLNHSISYDNFEEFQDNFRRFFNNTEISIGFSQYDADIDSFVAPPGKPATSFLLGDKVEMSCKSSFCECSYDKVIKQKKYFTVSNIDAVLEEGENFILSQLQKQGFKSCIIAPIIINDELVATLEIVSPNKNDLTSINANRLDIIMPYLTATAERSIQESENYIKAIIQNECTSIHPTVLWKFEEEARKYMEATLVDNKTDVAFNDMVFNHVYPLFGQIDIIGSSIVRNQAIQEDFIEQLKMVKAIFKKAYKVEKLAFYEQVILRIDNFITEFSSDFNATSEEQLLHFLKNEVNPIMPHIEKLSTELKASVDAYENVIDQEIGIVYNKRKEYENTVQFLNTHSAALLDEKQKEAQAIFPHFFERFKTDGVEHNMYIGQSLVKNKTYNKVYLNNLRLWQLTTMCEMERSFYEVQKGRSLQLDCASLVLVFGNSLSISFRVDEKKFDVDGAYNARYEIVKKRIDKAHIKGTNERITQKRKLVIVYSQKKDELEYLRYIQYLQRKGYLEEGEELVQLEDLQGVVGLKAIRVNIKYQTKEQKITYDDLVKELKS